MSLDLEQLCQAIDIIVSERLSDISFDSTMICTITDASDKDQGHYIVSDGTIRFDAYTNDTSYNVNDQVRVSVLNGNFNERKFIDGPYIGDSTGAPVTYISPLSTALPLEENIIKEMGSPQNISSYQLHTNTEDEVLLWSVDISNDAKYQTLQSNGIYNTITLSADFMTDLGNLSQGNYGLVLDFFIKQSKDSDSYSHRYVTFDSSEMIGNPYSFEIYSHQEKKINIAAFGMISMIRLSAYEGVKFADSGNENEKNARLGSNRIDNPFLNNDGSILTSKPINIRNIQLGFGNDLIAVTNNTLQLYTTSSIYYNYIEPSETTNSKDLGLIWLNKTDTNEYIGYNDGIFDLTYDEIQYREASNGNSRLEAQMGKTGVADDEESLTLAANITEAESYMIKAYEALTTDLSQVLQALGRQLSGAPSILNNLNKLIKNYESGQDVDNNPIYSTPQLTECYQRASQATSKLIKFYSQILNYGYNVQNQITPNVWNEKGQEMLSKYPGNISFYINENDSTEIKNELSGVVNWDYANYYTDFVNGVNDGINKVIDFFTNDETGMTVMTAAGTTLNGYSGICDTYYTRANAIIAIIRDSLDRVDKIFKDKDGVYDVVKLQRYNQNSTDENKKISYISYDNTEVRKLLAKSNNKYCIYWYHYSPGFILQYDDSENADNTEYLYGNFAGANWKRITHIPKAFTQAEFSTYGKDIFTVALNGKKEPVFSKATTWTEDTQYYIECINIGLPQSPSNIKVLDETGEEVKDDNGNNLYYYPAQGAEGENIVSLYLNPSTQEEKIKVILFKNHEMITSNIIEFENVDDVPEDKKVDASDVLRIEHDVSSQDHYQIYSSDYSLVNIADGSKMRQLKCYYDGILSGDETLVDSWLYWYVPTTSTLLTYDKDYLVNTLGFSTDADAEEKLEYSLDNYVYFAKKVEAEETAVAANNETTDASTVKLKDATRIFAYQVKSTYEPTATNNTILVKARIPGYNESVNGEKYFSFSTFGNNGTKYTLAVTPSGNRTGYCTEVKAADGTIITAGGLNLNITLSDAENQPLQMRKNGDSTTTGNLLDVNFLAPTGRSLPIDNYNVITDSLDWNAYIYDANLWTEVEEEREAIKHFLGIIKANVVLYNDVTNQNVMLETLYPIPYAANPEYYISGPTVIVYNNQGTVSRISEAPFKLLKHSADGDVIVTPDDPEKYKIEWSLSYYNSSGNVVDIDNVDISNNIYAYMPKLNADNTITPAPLYFTYEETDGESDSTSEQYYPVAKCEMVEIGNEANNRTLLWSQPIVIIQNKYASSALNTWDGRFNIDEANGTLMTTMIGAGKKTFKNTFEGVLMGDIVAGGGFDPDNASGLGIYGFNDGNQSFYFGVNGKAFLGKAGRGRIHFDGNSGTIASASYEEVRRKGEQLTSAGMFIDLDDGFIHMLGSTIIDETYSPDYPDSKTSQAEVLISTGLKHGEKDAYFKIRSKQQPNLDHYLMYVDSDQYYLQTDNYIPTTYSPSDISGTIPAGNGLHLNLQNGLLDAYNFKLVSKNVYIDSTDDSTAFFIIKDNYGINLLYAGTDGSNNEIYYLKSSDYDESLQKGTKINLTDGSIISYDFTLRAGNTKEDNPTIELTSSGTPYLRIRNDDDKTLLSIQKKTTDPTSGAIITNEEFVLQSGNYVSGSAGTRLDLVNNTLSAYSGFTLKAYKGTQYVLLDATASAYPLKVYGSDKKYFQVNWDGGLTATGADIKGTINATSGSFNGTITAVEGEIGGWTINADSLSGTNITLNSGGSMSCGSGFSVDSAGGLTATSGTIGGWTIGPTELSSGGVTFGPSGFTDTSGFTTLTDLEVVNSLTVSGTGILTCNGGASFSGDTSVTGNLSITGGLTIDTASLIIGTATAYAADAETIRVDVPFEKGYDITIHNGIITGVTKVEESGLTSWWNSITGDNGTAGKALGQLAWLDEVIISSATFKLGSGSAYDITPTLSGNTATFTVDIPGQSYDGYAGYSDTRYIYVDNPSTSVKVATSHPGKGWTYKTSVTLGGDEYYIGTTDARTGTINITVTAQ